MNLVWLLLIPSFGGCLAWPAERLHPALPRWISVAALLLDVLILLPMLHGLAPSGILGQGHWLAAFDGPWIPTLGIDFRLGIDGLSWLLVALTVGLGILAVIVSWTEIDERIGFFHANLLWCLAGTIGVFIAFDLFLFFFFWELMLVPTYFIVALWGHENRMRAAVKFFLFTQGSGLLMLAGILALAFVHLQNTGNLTFNYFALLNTHMTNLTELLIALGFFMGFAVKLPVFPFHTWLPETHTEAPTAGSVVLAGVLLKTGGYGLLRFVLPLFPAAAHEMAPYAMWLGAIGIFYAAIIAFAQDDLKRLVAYSSISHMGFVMIGVFSFSALALQGTVALMIAHGLSTGALFIVVGLIQHRIHSRDLRRMGGLWTDLPKLSALGTLFVLASMGLPGFGNFVGEFLILLGVFAHNPDFAIAAAVGLIPAAIYSLIAIQRAFHGQAAVPRHGHDLGRREVGLMATLAAGVIVMGVYPQPIFELAAAGLANLQSAPMLAMLTR